MTQFRTVTPVPFAKTPPQLRARFPTIVQLAMVAVPSAQTVLVLSGPVPPSDSLRLSRTRQFSRRLPAPFSTTAFPSIVPAQLDSMALVPTLLVMTQCVTRPGPSTRIPGVTAYGWLARPPRTTQLEMVPPFAPIQAEPAVLLLPGWWALP